MANVHYGGIGDIWKHLPLAEILSIETPSTYWESHSDHTRLQPTCRLTRSCLLRSGVEASPR